MKVGKIPVAAIVLVLLVAASLILNSIYPDEYGFESPFMRGAFAGAVLVYLLYYVNIWVGARAGVKRDTAAIDRR